MTSEEVEFTPAPWELIPEVEQDGEWRAIGPLQGSDQIGIASIFCSKEDAFLASAAPDLYRALERVILCRGDEQGQAYCQAKRALAKARGIK